MSDIVRYIISQLFVLNNYVFAMLTYNVRKRKTILLFNMIAATSVLVGFALLGAYSGMAMSIITIIRTIIFLIDDKINGQSKEMQLKDWIIFFVVSSMCLVCAVFTYENWWSMISIFATILYSFSVCQKNMFVYRIVGIPTSIAWIIYNAYVKSIVGVALETALLIVEIIGVVRFRKETQRKRQVARLVSRLLG
ncbi:MAG: YgjV family protein [Clostridia bacterium]|nr:YgjV family protein [Clostridia bacterium]